MLKPVYYVQECPTCGRSLQIRVAYLGRRMVCQHCLGEFEATDPANKQNTPPVGHDDLLAHTMICSPRLVGSLNFLTTDLVSRHLIRPIDFARYGCAATSSVKALRAIPRQ